MTEANRWLTDLPADSPERRLLIAGKTARSPAGSVDGGWQALSVALGAAATTAAVTTKAVAASAVATKTVSTAAASTAATSTAAASATVGVKTVVGGLGLSIGAKSIAIGFAVGMGLLGAQTVVERVNHRDAATSNIAAQQSPSPRSRATAHPEAERLGTNAPPSRQLGAPVAAASVSDVVLPVGTETAPDRELAAAPDTASLSNVVPPVAAKPEPYRQLAAVLDTPSTSDSEVPESHGEIARPAAAKPTTNRAIAPSASLPAESPSLAEQALELAQAKRLVDAGAFGEAIRRLEASFIHDVHSALSEERDALYIQALDRSQRRAQAQNLAKRFIARYPNSPHAEKMRTLIAAE